jgi:hypothetical protein
LVGRYERALSTLHLAVRVSIVKATTTASSVALLATVILPENLAMYFFQMPHPLILETTFELPVVSDLLPHREIFAGDLLRRRSLGFETEGADLLRR